MVGGFAFLMIMGETLKWNTIS